jgi:peptidoglycan/LPS O-acetylase OafA/YrhL
MFKSDPQRLNGLQMLRFFAAFAVLLGHALQQYDIKLIDLGFLGVTFFFMLSGFVLTWAGSADAGILRSYRNRFARIYPLHVVTLLAVAAIAWQSNDTGKTLLQHLTLTQAWTNRGEHSFNVVSWSISAEAFFYLLFPFAILILRRFNTRALVATVVGLWLGQLVLGQYLFQAFGFARGGFLTYVFPPYRFLEFAVGIAVALLLQRGYRPGRITSAVAATVAAGGVAFIVVVNLTGMASWNTYSSAFLPCVVAIVWTLARREVDGHTGILANKYLMKLGDWSYALYMVQLIPIWGFGILLTGRADTLPGWFAAPAIVIAIALSALASEFIEKPAERLIRRGTLRLPVVERPALQV